MIVKLNEHWQIDGKLYLKGETIEVSESVYKGAIESGVKIEKVETKKKNEKTPVQE